MIGRVTVFGLVAVSLVGCAQMDVSSQQPKSTTTKETVAETVSRPKARPNNAAIAKPKKNARTVEQFDTTTAQERKAAVAVPVAAKETRLGVTIASLGNPTDPGFWAETGLVTKVAQGRLEYPETGKSVAVELRPSGGAAGTGSRVSLPALRLLGAPLTSLPELVVFADP